ncbi:MAG: peptide ABC transporter substrate-binding protein [Deltaproteobacteria bacterium]|nr:peptide ABC transporter substrate-binding protein [Deltaproteobacteria bacterium]
MTKHSAWRWSGVCCGLLVALCAAIGQPACKRRPAGQAVTKSVAGERYVNFHMSAEPEYIDPGLATGIREHQIVMALFEGLVEHDPKDGSPIPAVAERWEVTPDGRTYTFFLRNNAKWSDGHPVTANDFVYSWERVLNPKTASQYAFALFPILNAEEYNTGKLTDPDKLGFKATSDLTVQVTLKNPTPYFLHLSSLHSYRPVPRWAVEQHGTNWTRPEHIVTNGPFRLASWVPHKELLAIKNPTYWDAANVKSPGIRFIPIDDRETALKMYESGQLDLAWEVPTTKIQMLMGRPDLVKGPQLATYFLWVNTTKPPLNDSRVRRALALAIDRKVLSENYLQGQVLPWSSMVPTGLPGYMPAPGPDFNPTEAKRLLAEAGFADPSAFPPITFSYNTDERNKIAAEVVQQMWQSHLGITVNLLSAEWKSYIKELQQKNYQIGRMMWVGDYPDPNTFLEILTSASPTNSSGWANPKFDGLLQAAAAEVESHKRLESLRQAEALLLDELPVIPLWTSQKEMLVKPNVRGFYHNLQDVHPAKWIFIEESR